MGQDKPKRSDFNANHQKIDDSYYQLAEKMNQHKEDTSLHVTPKEKEQWAKGQSLKVQVYQGNGAQSRTISLGISPEFIMVQAIGKAPVQHADNTDDLAIYSGVACPSGASHGIKRTTDGLTVHNSTMADLQGNKLRLNESNVSYLCFYC